MSVEQVWPQRAEDEQGRTASDHESRARALRAAARSYGEDSRIYAEYTLLAQFLARSADLAVSAARRHEDAALPLRAADDAAYQRWRVEQGAFDDPEGEDEPEAEAKEGT